MKTNRKLIEQSVLFIIEDLRNKIKTSDSPEYCAVYAKAIKDCCEAFDLVHYGKCDTMYP